MRKPSALKEATLGSVVLPPSVLRRKCACGQHMIAGSQCESCSKEGTSGNLQRAAVNAEPANQVPQIVHEVLGSSGQALAAGERAFFESRFDHDFSQVRVHTDAKAAESARAVNASAYTVGADVVFAHGRYAPHTRAGRQLLAHELTHVVQQHGSLQRSSISPPLELGRADDQLEREADKAAQKLVEDEGGNPSVLSGAAAGRLQRHPAIVGLDEAGPNASLTEGKEQQLWQCIKANPDVCAPDVPLTWADFKGTPNKAHSAWTVAPVKIGELPSDVCKQRVLGTPAKPAMRFRAKLDSSKSWVRAPFNNPGDPKTNGCAPLITDCKSKLATPGHTYSAPTTPSTKCPAAPVPQGNVGTTVTECDTIVGADCTARQTAESDRLLSHEQGHLDISCAIATIANAALDAGGDRARIEAAVEKKRQDMYDLYDSDTNHGCKAAEQAAWKADIANNLKAQNITFP